MRWRLMRGLESSTPSLSEWRRQLPRYAPAYPGAVTQDSLGFVGDLPLEGVGFELSVPRQAMTGRNRFARLFLEIYAPHSSSRR